MLEGEEVVVGRWAGGRRGWVVGGEKAALTESDKSERGTQENGRVNCPLPGSVPISYLSRSRLHRPLPSKAVPFARLCDASLSPVPTQSTSLCSRQVKYAYSQVSICRSGRSRRPETGPASSHTRIVLSPLTFPDLPVARCPELLIPLLNRTYLPPATLILYSSYVYVIIL